MTVDGIENGIVLDHIEAGKAMLVYKYLHLDKLDSQVALIQNCSSRKMGKKDIVKISEDLDIDLDVLGYIDPGITVNYIKDGKRVDKKTLQLPETLTNVLKCKNPRCIISIEQELPQVFKIVDRTKALYRCMYCDTIVRSEELN
ncbi:aspartate carbamoyltransferase regulatory subunit [Oribacterium sp. NK2B42]|jgi:aspartate carbamoyltransferase regulatory subunit|uniref:aspartate carbamoyltransferase regulatory subunit n=1 Tax=Oribacterium sp. NK2B42 TaxID=689781 RepID=UPI00040FE2B0|nr:aspartate carbamoyltransferase regulatory subunit [Oribacterium sp. NK2B42]MBO5598384.1 aspartate carbamoyltransferase regulatory subunit [Oribacterium sp.]MBO6307399.1 aspartate carbamoyltransferase regulatory subunit [Oribacterium sp.]MBP3804219.1 aspartate carbamoyltransferase regulatory subunit [Oribacterium sp.]